MLWAHRAHRSCYHRCVYLHPGYRLLARCVNRRMKKKKHDRVIPRFKYDSSKEDRGYGRNIRLTEACQICLTDYVDGDDIRVFPQCGHAFHARSIDKWLNVNSLCPSCRSEIQLTALFYANIIVFALLWYIISDCICKKIIYSVILYLLCQIISISCRFISYWPYIVTSLFEYVLGISN